MCAPRTRTENRWAKNKCRELHRASRRATFVAVVTIRKIVFTRFVRTQRINRSRHRFPFRPRCAHPIRAPHPGLHAANAHRWPDNRRAPHPTRKNRLGICQIPRGFSEHHEVPDRNHVVPETTHAVPDRSHVVPDGHHVEPGRNHEENGGNGVEGGGNGEEGGGNGEVLGEFQAPFQLFLDIISSGSTARARCSLCKAKKFVVLCKTWHPTPLYSERVWCISHRLSSRMKNGCDLHCAFGIRSTESFPRITSRKIQMTFVD